MSAVERQRDDVQAERAAFVQELAQVDPSCIRVVDESRVVLGQRLPYGYSARGERCSALPVTGADGGPLRSKVTRSLVGWLALDGSGVVATHEGMVKGWTFRGFVKHHLEPHLRAGDVVQADGSISRWDNARIHGVEGIREMSEACGARLLPLPRYSPDLSPIELAWSKIKHLVKRARAATAEALEQAVAVGVAAVRASDAAGWFKHCGYIRQSG